MNIAIGILVLLIIIDWAVYRVHCIRSARKRATQADWWAFYHEQCQRHALEEERNERHP